ncbi:uncharacterized protein LOC134436073 [Engraulis encrasicolus]|uniref:uncharacterized protein LOC134436073 n=1 Tax=Engraulis encrasicolus TaxID=184585 RepID=UPI002FD16023
MEALQTGFFLEEGKSKLLLFEGKDDHLTPTCRLDLTESGLFIIAGRMMGHSFLHGGPSFTGLSPAIIHVILGRDPKMAPISVDDCVDWDVREVLELLEGTDNFTEDERERVNNICLYWDLPTVDRENRQWLTEKILLHAVLGRTEKQVEQLQRGLRDSGVYDLLSARPDTAAILFPRTSEREITPQMILDHITWPANVAYGVSRLDQDRILGFFRRFIENGTPDVLKSLLRFWTGWEVLSGHLKVEVIVCDLPMSATCFYRLKLPAYVQEFEEFTNVLKAVCETSSSGFGQV